MTERCGVCFYGQQAGGELVRCRRYPPVARPITTADRLANDEVTVGQLRKTVTAWPWTGAADWCGEFRRGGGHDA